MIKSTIAASILTCTSFSATAAKAETVNLLIWESYIDQGVLDRFTRETGIAVNQIYYDSGDARDEILSNPESNIDLAVVGENAAQLFGNRGVLEPLTEANVASLKDYGPQWRLRCAGFGLPYLWGTVGIVYRSDKVKEAPTSWNDLMTPKPELRKHIAMYDDHAEAFVAPLTLLGKSINANDSETLKAAFEVMKKQAPSVLTYNYIITAVQNPQIGGNIYMALAYSGDQHVLNDKAGTPGVWRYTVPKEGTLSWLDCMSVNAHSPRKALALKFLDYLGSPESAAANAESLSMPTASTAALKLIPEAIRDNPEIYTPADILAKSQYQEEAQHPIDPDPPPHYQFHGEFSVTLGKRAFLMIFPVVLAGYLLAAVAVYLTESHSIKNLEQARLSQQLDHLAAFYRADMNRSRGFLYSILEGNAIRLFLYEQDETYRNNALGLRLQQTLRSLSDDQKTFLSFTIINPDLTPAYYFENSDDPFAELGTAQKDLAKQLIHTAKLRDWTFLRGPDMRPLIVYSEFVDRTTLARPLPTGRDNALLIQVAIEPTQFLEMKRSLELEYGAKTEFLTVTPAVWHDKLSAGVRLAPSLFLTLDASATYGAAGLDRLKLLLGFGALAMSVISVSLMSWLITRFITDPISALDRQVTAVMSGRSEGILDTGAAGEIGRLTGNIKQLHDQSSRSLKLVQHASWTDTLTGISNRGHFNGLAATIVQETVESGRHCSLLFIDIDHFKFVNDKHGHEVGDELLRKLAVQLRETVDTIVTRRGLPPAVLARLSGDEFAVLLQSVPGDGTVRETCDAILQLFDGGFAVRGKHYPVTASIGVAICPDDAANLAELISNADAAMYQAKTTGKNRSSRFSRALKTKRDRVRLIQEELRVVDPDEQFHLVYMPIVDGAGTVVGCEALLRWVSPTLGNVRPDEFVPIAESSGQFTKIDCWVIDRAMGDYQALQGLFGAETTLAINISSAELHSKSIAGHFNDCVERHGIRPGAIEIELTETYAVTLGDQLRQNIEALRARGFRISIDDFGAGYTSMQQIIEYTADTIKLDRALVANLAREEMLPALKAVIALCHAQNMQVIGEGVDTEGKLAILSAAGCDHYQGYLISKPLTLEDLGVWALKRTAELAGRSGEHEPAAGDAHRARAESLI